MSKREENEFVDPKVMNAIISEFSKWIKEEVKTLHQRLDAIENRIKRRGRCSSNMRCDSSNFKHFGSLLQDNQGRRGEQFRESKPLATAKSIPPSSANQKDAKVPTDDDTDEPKIPVSKEDDDQLLLPTESMMENKEKVMEMNKENLISTNDSSSIPSSISSLSQDSDEVIPDDTHSNLPSFQVIEHQIDSMPRAYSANSEKTKELKRYIGKFEGRVQHEVFTNKFSFRYHQKTLQKESAIESTKCVKLNGAKVFLARASDWMGVVHVRLYEWYAKQVNKKSRNMIFDPGGFGSLDDVDTLDLRTNPLQEEGNDGVRESLVRDPIQVLVTRARAKKCKDGLIVLIQEAWAQELNKRPNGEGDLIGPRMVIKIEGDWAEP